MQRGVHLMKKRNNAKSNRVKSINNKFHRLNDRKLGSFMRGTH